MGVMEKGSSVRLQPAKVCPRSVPPALPRPNILNLAPLPHYSKPSYAYVLKIEQFRFSTKEAVIKIQMESQTV